MEGARNALQAVKGVSGQAERCSCVNPGLAVVASLLGALRKGASRGDTQLSQVNGGALASDTATVVVDSSTLACSQHCG